MPEGKSQMFYFWYFTAGSTIFYLAYTIFATPWVALRLRADTGLSRAHAPDGRAELHRAARLCRVAVVPVDHDATRTGSDAGEGARSLAIGIGIVAIVVGMLPAIFLRERFSSSAAKTAESLRARVESRVAVGEAQYWPTFAKGFATTLKSEAVPQALRGDVPGVQRLHHDLVVPVLRDHLLRVRRQSGAGRRSTPDTPGPLVPSRRSSSSSSSRG